MKNAYAEVESSLIDAIAHVAGDLYVWLTSNRLYRYRDVPPEVFEDFRSASSKGRYFNNFIKGRYAWHELAGSLRGNSALGVDKENYIT